MKIRRALYICFCCYYNMYTNNYCHCLFGGSFHSGLSLTVLSINHGNTSSLKHSLYYYIMLLQLLYMVVTLVCTLGVYKHTYYVHVYMHD